MLVSFAYIKLTKLYYSTVILKTNFTDAIHPIKKNYQSALRTT